MTHYARVYKDKLRQYLQDDNYATAYSFFGSVLSYIVRWEKITDSQRRAIDRIIVEHASNHL